MQHVVCNKLHATCCTQQVACDLLHHVGGGGLRCVLPLWRLSLRGDMSARDVRGDGERGGGRGGRGG